MILYFLTIIAVAFMLYFISILWIAYGFYKSKKKQIKANNSQQKISVIIPVRNEALNIENCLSSLISQHYEGSNFEIIIVNDHSEDETVAIVQDIAESTEISISLINLSDEFSKKEALKAGVEIAKYSIIASTDGDCILPKKWLLNISDTFQSNVSMLIAPVMFKQEKGFLNAFQILDFSAIQGLTFGSSYYNLPILNNAANLSYLKSDLNAVGGYDNYQTPSGDDVFLLEKFYSSNLSIKASLDQESIVYTSSEKTWYSFFSQRIRWASKTGFYTNNLLRFFSALIFGINIFTLIIYLIVFLFDEFQVIALILLFSRWLIDFILLFLVTSFFRKKKVLWYFIPIQLIYPVYVLLIGLAAKLFSFEWKGRKV